MRAKLVVPAKEPSQLALQTFTAQRNEQAARGGLFQRANESFYDREHLPVIALKRVA
jgi:hypothetical protein